MSQIKINYDAIIVGAGMAGLVCGCYLAKAGMRILIIEQQDKPGGYFTSFKRKGFLFDAAAHSFGNYREGGLVRKILTELGVNSILKIKRSDPSDIIITPDFKITFWNDIKATLADLSRIFPEEKTNLINFFSFFTSTDQSKFMTLKTKTFRSFLQSFFRDERLLNALALPVLGNGGLPPSLMHAFNGTKVFTESIIDGGYYPEGGMQNLPDALVQIIEQHGGKVLYKRAVKRILMKNNSATGVTLDSNESHMSKYVISACDLIQTFTKFLEKTAAGMEMQHILHNMIPSLSTLILYIGIDEPFDGLPPSGVNTWHLPHYDLDEIYDQMQKGDLNKSGTYMVRVSPDYKTVLAFTNAPFISKMYWKNEKKKAAEDFLSRLEKLMPNLKKHIVYFDAATPATLFRYTLNYRGAAYGWASTPSQMFIPELRHIPNVKDLFLAGHWTGIGSGLPGAFYSGFETAQRIIRKNNKNTTVALLTKS